MPFVEAEFADTGEPIRAIRMELRRASFQHEVVILRAHSDYAGRHPTGAPVRVSWGSFPSAQEDFYGYVHHDEPVTEDDERTRTQRPMTDIVCSGVTSVLGEDASRAWLNTRLDLLVATVANEAKLLHAADRGDRVISNAVQAAESSWKFLTRRAKAEGKVLFAYGPRVVLVDRTQAAADRLEHALSISRSEAIKVSGAVGELNVVGREAVTREAYGLARGGLVAHTDRKRTTELGYRPAPREKRIITGSPVNDAGGLSRSVEGKDREERFLHDLTVKVSGVRVGLGPCSVVELENFGRRYDGHWSVDSVKFRVFPSSESTTEVGLVKVPVRGKIARRGSVPMDRLRRSETSRMRLVGDRWVSRREVFA